MKIEKLYPNADRAGKYRVLLEDGSVMRLYRQTIEDFGLYSGLEMTDQQFSQLQTAAGAMSAKMRAVRIVSASSVSKKDLEQRLIHKGEDPQQAKDAVDWMSNMSLLDDEKTAEQIVSRCISKGYGLARAKQVLFEKRIPRDLWDRALEGYPDQTEKIVSFLRSRLDGKDDPKAVKRAIDALMRRGHSYRQIRAALDRLSLDSEEFTEEV